MLFTAVCLECLNNSACYSGQLRGVLCVNGGLCQYWQMGRAQISLLQSASSFGWPLWCEIQSRPVQARSHLLCLLAKSPKCRVFVLKSSAGFDVYVTSNEFYWAYIPNTAKQRWVSHFTPGSIFSLGVLRSKIISFEPNQIEWYTAERDIEEDFWKWTHFQETRKGFHLILWSSLDDSFPALFPPTTPQSSRLRSKLFTTRPWDMHELERGCLFSYLSVK